jgi:glycosyltransferase involved in cell wall biosynthesis
MKVSIVTATYNSAATLGDCLQAVQTQSYGDIEHVVIDGASRDGTMALLNQHRDKLAVLISEPDKGIYDALNKGIAHATGDVVGFLHSDDFYADADVIARVAAAFADPTVHAVYGDLDYVSKVDTTKRIRHWRAGHCKAWDLALGWMPPHPTLFVRRHLYDTVGGFDLRFKIAADYHSVLKLFSIPGFKSTYLPQVLVKMRVGGASNRSLANILRKSREDLSALTLTGHRGGVLTLVAKNLRKVHQFV